MAKKKYRVVDLFSGCGGISVGFNNTKRVNVVGAIDFDQDACNTFQKNFPKTKVICGDINQIEVSSTGFSDVDIIIGGPPCQGFSRLNYWDKDRDNDPRNELFFQYLRFVKELRPKAILIENVKNILMAKDGYVPMHITNFLSEIGYTVTYQILSADDFGVPQRRPRAFFVAIQKELEQFDFSSLEKYKLPLVTVGEALSDIDSIEVYAKELPQGTVYDLPKPMSAYQKKMQAKDRKLHNHMIYYPTPHVQEMIIHVPEGGNWRCVPKELFKSDRNNRYTNYLRRLRRDAPSITIDTGHNVYFHPPDFVNAPPKLRFVARYVEKWFHCEVLLRQEECLSEVSPVFRHPYPDCRDSFGCLKHLIDTHPNLVNGNESLQFLIYLIGDEANADMCLYPTFCKMKHRTHFQSSF